MIRRRIKMQPETTYTIKLYAMDGEIIKTWNNTTEVAAYPGYFRFKNDEDKWVIINGTYSCEGD
jgi:hypothetical protein